ncbi:MAG: sodium:solute symporter family protein [Solirubrobacterales bacterium]
MSLHLPLLLAYCVLQIALGLWIGRRVKTTGDFFVAGRALGPGLLFATMVAANIGAGSTVGAAGLGYRDGLAAWWWVGSAAIGSVILAFTVGPRIRRVAAEHGLHTVGDYLEHRYGSAVRGTVSALLWLGTLAILAGQLIALAWVLHVVADVPKWAGCLVGGIVMTIYFTAGGLLTSAWVNLVQLVVMLAGFAIALPVVFANAGGLGAVMRATPGDGYWSAWQNGASGWMYLVFLGPAFIISPGLLQKIYGARDDRTVRLGVGWNAVVLLAFSFAPPLLGMAARAMHPDLANHELALPTVFMKDLPALLGTLGLAAVVSAEVSSADAILFMLATSLSQDLYRRFVNPGASDAQVLRIARWAAVAGGAAGVGLAIVSPSVIGVLSFFYTVLTVSLFVPVVAGLYVRRVGTPEAAAAVGVGITALLAVQLATSGRGWGAFTPALLGLLAAIAACAIVGLWRRGSEAPR